MAVTKRKSIIIVVNSLDAFLSHRLPIGLAAQASGFKVKVVYGEASEDSKIAVLGAGIEALEVPIRRGGINLFSEILSVFAILKLFLTEKPDLVHLVTLKPILYGGLCARLAKIPAVVFAVAGMGFIYTSKPTIKIIAIQTLLKVIFCLALRHKNNAIIFQNTEDKKTITEMMGQATLKTCFIKGSGVDLKKFRPVRGFNGQPIIVMASRMLADKGVREFVGAAKVIKTKGLDSAFLFAGVQDPDNPSSICQEELDLWKKEGFVSFMGHRRDIENIYNQAHIIVLPSYREGLPKALIEASACGRPIVTTDACGCRDTIIPDVTGILVKPRDITSLANAIEKLIINKNLVRSMGSAGRRFAEKNFSIEKVVEQHLDLYKGLLF